MAFHPLSMILWPHHFTTFHSLGFIALLNSRLIISLPLSAKSSYLFCCHFITGSSYQAVQNHVTVPNLSQVPILLIRDYHEMGYMVYSRSLMLEKVQSPLKAMPVTFWILGQFFCCCSSHWLSLKVIIVWVSRPEKFTGCTSSILNAAQLAPKGTVYLHLIMSSGSHTAIIQDSIKHGPTSVGK